MNKVIQKKENEVYRRQSYKDDQLFGYKLLGAIKCSSTLQLH
jgi:hypothetical protein